MSSSNFPQFGGHREYNPNDNNNLTTAGMVETLLINTGFFLLVLALFEFNRFYKQIYLKRLQKKFQITNRVPPEPPLYMFGWLFELQKISETDVLRMVGLDAYMLLRYLVICYKLSIFLCFWGLVVLLPIYASAAPNDKWDRFSISNLLLGEGMRYRLWISAIFSYIFAAYFCQLLFIEYNNFSVRRLQYLVQAEDSNNPEKPFDPDTPQQKYYTVMIERIPSHLRSASQLYKFFDKLFPGDVFTVEVALDLKDLEAKNRLRKRIRDSLEKVIAHYEAKNERTKILVHTEEGSSNIQDTVDGIFGEDGIPEFIWKSINPEKFGFRIVDAIHYYTNTLIKLNNEVKDMQVRYIHHAQEMDSRLKDKLKKKHDTRMATLFEKLTANPQTLLFPTASTTTDTKPAAIQATKPSLSADITFPPMAPVTPPTPKTPTASTPTTSFPTPSLYKIFNAVEKILFVPTKQDYKKVLSDEMEKVDEDIQLVHLETSHSVTETSTFGNEVSTKTPFLNPSGTATAEEGEKLRQSFVKHSSMITPGSDISGSHGVSLEGQLNPVRRRSSRSHSISQSDPTHIGIIGGSSMSISQDYMGSISHEGSGGGIHVDHNHDDAAESILASDATFKLWKQSSGMNFAHEEKENAQRRKSYETVMNSAATSSMVMEGEEDPREEGPGQVVTSTSMISETHPIGEASGDDRFTQDNVSVTGQSEGTSILNPLLRFNRTTVNPLITAEQVDQMNRLAKEGFEKAKLAAREGWNQTKLAGDGAWKSVIEVERTAEVVFLGAYYKYSSTAFVTFNSRVTESVAHQMLLSHDSMEINHAPNPHDIIWDNVANPKNQIVLRNYIANIGIIIGSIFWSSLVNSVNVFASYFPIAKSQQQLTSAVIMLVFLLLLPWVFDFLARFYEGLKLESEVQNSIMTRYFYYQLVNVYVTVGFSGTDIWSQIVQTLSKPQTLVDIIGGHVPLVSLFFTNLLIVKIFAAIPLEMIRPWQLSTILLMSTCIDKRETTRRDLRTGAFYSWPMLYGWIYPQLMMVLMIMVTYSCITPLLMPFCILFFASAYMMYKYQLLYVYINDYQSGGHMWYAVFNRSLVSLVFASVTLLGYLSLQLSDPLLAGPFYFLLPLPFCIVYFGRYCDLRFRKSSMNLSYGFAIELDLRNDERKKAGKPIPHDTFKSGLYRQPSMMEGAVYPEPYRNDGTYDLSFMEEEGIGPGVGPRGVGDAGGGGKRFHLSRLGSLSINVHELVNEGEDDPIILEQYFHEVVLPLAVLQSQDVDEDGEERKGGYGIMDKMRRGAHHVMDTINKRRRSSYGSQSVNEEEVDDLQENVERGGFPMEKEVQHSTRSRR